MAAITSRYARAFAEVVFEKKMDALKAAEALRGMVALVESNPELKTIWENPSVPAEQKRAVLDAITRKIDSPAPLRNFIAVIIDHERVAQLGEIAQQFEAEINQRLNRAEAEITSARELIPEERREMEGKIASVTGKSVKAKYEIDPKLLGGAIIRVGSTVYDGSVRGQLQKLKEELIGT